MFDDGGSAGLFASTSAEGRSQARKLLDVRLRESGIHFEGRPYPVELQPLVLTTAEADAVRSASVAVHGLLERVAGLYRADPEVRAYFPDYLQAVPWLTADTGTRPEVFVCRLDGVLVDGRYQVMETNACCPGGVIQTGLAHRIWSSVVQEELGVDVCAAVPPPAMEDPLLFVRGLARVHRRRTGRDPGAAAVVMLNGRYRNEVHRIAAGLVELGVDAAVVDAGELSAGDVGGRLRWRGRSIDLTYNKLDQVELIRSPLTRSYLSAAARGEVTFVNTLLAQCVLEDKAVLALLGDDRFADRFTGPEREVVAQHVPWTRRVVPELVTVPDGSREDLADHLRRRREHLVLKPTNKTRGEGVVVGPFTTPAGWEKAVDDALNASGRYVVQSYLPLLTAFGDDTPGLRRRAFHGIDTYLFDGEFAGFHCRVSGDPVVNIGLGGALRPVLVREEGR